LEQWKYRAGFKRIDGSVSLGKMAMAMQTQAECCWQGLNGQNQRASTRALCWRITEAGNHKRYG